MTFYTSEEGPARSGAQGDAPSCITLSSLVENSREKRSWRATPLEYVLPLTLPSLILKPSTVPVIAGKVF